MAGCPETGGNGECVQNQAGQHQQAQRTEHPGVLEGQGVDIPP